MVAFIIIAGILLLITLLLLCPVKLSVTSDGNLSVKAGVGPIKLDVLKKKKKKLKLRDFSQRKYLDKIGRLRKAKKDPPEKKKKEENGEKTPLSETAGFILEILGRAETYTGRLRTRVKRLDVTVGGTDPAEAAIAYGVACQTVAYLIEILDGKTKLIRRNSDRVNVKVDYFSPKLRLDADVELSIRVVDGIRTAIEILMLKAKRESNIINTRKAGQANV